MKDKRFDLITETILKNSNIEMIISYERSLSELLLEHFSNQIKSRQAFVFGKNQKYELVSLSISEKKQVKFLRTPFFGQGQISYDGIWNIVKAIC